MPVIYAIYACPRLRRGESPRNETMVESGFKTAREAMARAHDMRRADAWHTYFVGAI